MDDHNDIKVGNIITAYHAGYHRVVGFHNYNNHKDGALQVEYQTVLNKAGKPNKSKKTKSCHVTYCKVVNETDVQTQFETEIKAAEEKRDNILSVLATK